MSQYAIDSGGPKIVDGRVVLVFWGAEWQNGSADPTPVIDAVRSVLRGPYLGRMSQYGTGPMTYEAEVFVSPIQTSTYMTDIGNRVIYGDTDAMLQTSLGPAGAPLPSAGDSATRFYVVMIPPGIDCGANYTPVPGTNSYLYTGSTEGYHGRIWINGYRVATAVVLDGSAYIFGHELVEAMADFDPWSGQGVLVRNTVTNKTEEIADACYGTPGANVDGVGLPPYWSESDRLCIVPGAPRWDVLTPPGLTFRPHSVSAINRWGQLLAFGLKASEGGVLSSLAFMLQDQPPLVEATFDEWWTETEPPRWLAWTDIGGDLGPLASRGQYAAAVNEDGSLRVFVINHRGELWQNGETVSPFSTSIWRGWFGWDLIDDLKGRGLSVDAHVDRERQIVLLVGAGDRPGIRSYRQERPNSRKFDAPQPLDFDPFSSGPEGVVNVGGEIEAFALHIVVLPTGGHGTVRHQWELLTPLESWADRAADLALSGVPPRPAGLNDVEYPIAVGKLQDGRVAVFVRDSKSGRLWYGKQTPSPPWGSFEQLGGPVVTDVRCANEDSGFLVVIAIDHVGKIWIRKQRDASRWDPWVELPTPGGAPEGSGSVESVAIVIDRHDRLDLIAERYDGSVYHARQIHPSGSWIE